MAGFSCVVEWAARPPTTAPGNDAMPIRRGYRRRDLWTRMLAKIDARIAEVEPIATQQAGGPTQSRAAAELASLRKSREQAAKSLDIAINGLRPTK